MSWSVMAARTRIWRTMVAIIRGGNLGGAAWQRAQLERKRLSPSRCMFSFCAAWLSDWPAGAAAAAVSFGASLLPPLLALAASPSDMAPATRNAAKANLIFIIARLLAAASASQSDRSCQSSRDWRFCPGQIAGHSWRKHVYRCAGNSSCRNRLPWCLYPARQAFLWWRRKDWRRRRTVLRDPPVPDDATGKSG